MINLSQLIKKACQEQGINIQELAARPGVDMSTSGLYAALSNNSLKVKTLEAIAKELEVPMSYFFIGTEEKSDLRERMQFLDSQLEDRNRILQLSDQMLKKNEDIIHYLSEQVSRIKSRYKELQVNFGNIDEIYEEEIEDGKKKSGAEKKLKLLREELEEIRQKVSAIISE